MSHLAKALRVVELFSGGEIQKTSPVLLCFGYELVNKKVPICISCNVKTLRIKRKDKLNRKVQKLSSCKGLTILLPNNRICVSVEFTAKKNSIAFAYFVIRCEAKFSKVRLGAFQVHSSHLKLT